MKLKNLFFDRYGLRDGWLLVLFLSTAVFAMVVGVASILGASAFISHRDCPTVCAAQDAEPVWTFANGCACAKNGDLTKPLAKPVEVNLR